MRRAPALRVAGGPANGRRGRARPPGRARRRARQPRVELVQMPTQPLLGAAALVDEIVAVDTNSFSSRYRSSPARGRSKSGSRNATRATASASIGSDLPRVRPRTSSGAGQLRRHPHELFTRSDQLPLERRSVTCRQSSTAHNRLTQTRSPHQQRRVRTLELQLARAAAPPRRPQPPSTSACVRPHRSRSFDSPPTDEGATGERTGLTRGSCQAPIRSRSTVSGRRRRHNTGKSAPTDSPEWSQPPPTRVSCAHRTPPSHRE